jgi:hypothetical protein
MDLTIEPDVYAPSIDEHGNYVDMLPSFHIIKNGIYCPCGSRKNKNYETHQKFSTHIKSQAHKKWLENLNLNKTNYYVDCNKLNELVKNQRLIIAQMELDVNNKNRTIDYLTHQLTLKNSTTVTNLLELDY